MANSFKFENLILLCIFLYLGFLPSAFPFFSKGFVKEFDFSAGKHDFQPCQGELVNDLEREYVWYGGNINSSKKKAQSITSRHNCKYRYFRSEGFMFNYVLSPPKNKNYLLILQICQNDYFKTLFFRETWCKPKKTLLVEAENIAGTGVFRIITPSLSFLQIDLVKKRTCKSCFSKFYPTLRSSIQTRYQPSQEFYNSHQILKDETILIRKIFEIQL